jgi:hypothetical protein
MAIGAYSSMGVFHRQSVTNEWGLEFFKWGIVLYGYDSDVDSIFIWTT